MRIEEWTHVDLVSFDTAKCKILPLGWGKHQYQYKLSAGWIESIPAKNLGYWWMKIWTMCNRAQTASCILGCIEGSETSRFREVILPLNSAEEPSLQE